MEKFKSTEIKLIGAFFLVAGLFGFFRFLILIFPIDNFVSLFNLFPTMLYGLTLYSGYLLLIKEDEKGLEIGRAVISLQIINFNIAGLGYVFITGAYLFFGFRNLNVHLNFGLDNIFLVNLYEESADFIFNINILALGVFLYLSRTLSKIEREKEIREELERDKANGPQHSV